MRCYGWILAGLLIAAPVIAHAQSSTAGPNGAQNAAAPPAKQSAAKKTANPAAAKPAAAKPAKPEAAARRLPQDTIDRTAVGSARPVERPIPREQPIALGRLSIPGGSLGYESETSMKAYDLSDGRRVPGYENIQRNDSSYFGLSVRMPTSGSLFRSHSVD